MLTDLGMTPVEMNRFKRKVSEVLGLVSIFSPHITSFVFPKVNSENRLHIQFRAAVGT